MKDIARICGTCGKDVGGKSYYYDGEKYTYNACVEEEQAFHDAMGYSTGLM